jgi:endonuclease VIII
MPEGDTIFRVARTLNRALAGHRIHLFESVYAQLSRVNDDSPIAGRTVERVEARGKWLLIHFSGDLIPATHMLMKGSWHLYRIGERWQIGHQRMRIRLQTEDFEVVAFDVSVAQFYTERTFATQSAVPKLGPDVLGHDFREEEVVARVHAHPEEEIANLLLNQKVIAGIGNVYKSEVCFLCGIHPFRLVKSLSREEVNCLLKQAHKLMSANTAENAQGITTYAEPRRTTHYSGTGARMWVYGRQGRQCRKCGALIRMAKQGENARSTYWCPDCQKEY